ncbi:hypothetical protein ISN44_As02g020560, partial [Arabidopsis suecica]
MTNGGGGMSSGEGFRRRSSGEGFSAREFRWWVSGDRVPARVFPRGFFGEGVQVGVPTVVSGEGVPAKVPGGDFFGKKVPAVVFRRVSSSDGGGRGSGGGGSG